MNDLSMTTVADASFPTGTSSLDFLWLELTNRCNLECIHCYADSRPTEPINQQMSYHNWLTVLRDAFTLGCRRVQFIGGEPTLHPHLIQLIIDATNVGYDFIEVYTNGTLLQDALLDVFTAFNVRLAFSLYGSDAEIHEKITQRQGSYVRTIRNLRKALDCGLTVRVAVIAMSENSFDIHATMDGLHSLGVESIGTDRLRGIGRGKAQLDATDDFGELCGACGRGQLAINAQGNVFPCVFSRFCNLGNASSGLRSILHGEKLQSFRMNAKERRESNATDRWVAECKPSCAPYTTSISQ